MFSCLIVSQSDSYNEERSRLFQSILYNTLKDHPYTKKQLQYEECIIISNADFTLAWQTVLNLECSGFLACCGFGDSEEIAMENAFEKWRKRKNGIY
ncbi:MAG TPA: hypothetical protein GX497_08400 [Bacillus bacterium]|nr:hypothetical protein [Bacillus sp. (in: firmicutes)]